MQFYSAEGQDRFLFETFFRGRRGGVFVDVGAYDGERASNSLFFERFLGWRGLCIEPLPSAYAALVARRSSPCEQLCVGEREGQAEFAEFAGANGVDMLSGLADRLDPSLAPTETAAADRSIRSVRVLPLSRLLEQHGLSDVDYCSIDASGGEFAALAGLDLDRHRVGVLSVRCGEAAVRLREFMQSKHYELVARIGPDLVFKRPDVRTLARTSVICAVWHKDPQRLELLRGHFACLARQTVPVDPIYVFDGTDEAPDWLEARKIIVRGETTIYQAWNVALSLVETPFVMNLNLDDRLAPDAVATLESSLSRDDTALIGGDWKICYSQAETDAVENCFPAERLPFVGDWPPAAGTRTRLGSGTGERGTYGPAVMWRVDTHVGAPRYSWRLPDGTPLKVAGDSAWWTVVTQHLKRKARRLPIVVGNYYSNPSSQAEFRHPNNELEPFSQQGLPLM